MGRAGSDEEQVIIGELVQALLCPKDLGYNVMMMQVTIHEAQAQLSKLIQQALAGEEVIIAKGQQPLVRLVA